MLDEYERRKKPVPVLAKTSPKPSKYASEKVEHQGEKFDSKKEGRRWLALLELQKAGKISDLKRQQSFVLAPAVKLAGEARTKPALRYLADFTFMRDGVLVIEDCKSKPTRKLPIFRAKKHLMKTVLGLDITET